jgi:hypothetical protein
MFVLGTAGFLLSCLPSLFDFRDDKAIAVTVPSVNLLKKRIVDFSRFFVEVSLSLSLSLVLYDFHLF